jgi:hypothetical protein
MTHKTLLILGEGRYFEQLEVECFIVFYNTSSQIDKLTK